MDYDYRNQYTRAGVFVCMSGKTENEPYYSWHYNLVIIDQCNAPLVRCQPPWHLIFD